MVSEDKKQRIGSRDMSGARNVSVQLVAPDRGSRAIIKTILTNMGFLNVSTSEGVEDLGEVLKTQKPDLIIVDARVPDGDMCQLVRDLRHNEVGANPFVPVVAITGDPTTDLVRGVIDSGADDLLIQPYSTGQFIDRISTLVDKRKPFVVTSDYIGPDRRSNARKGEGEEIPHVDVPNTLRARMKGEMNTVELDEAVAATLEEVNLMRLDRNGNQVVWLVTRIIAGFAWSNGAALEPEVEAHILRLKDVAIETGKRLRGTPFEHVAHICDGLLDVATRMAKDKHKSEQRDQDVLKELSKAFAVAFKPDNAGRVSADIQEVTDKIATLH